MKLAEIQLIPEMQKLVIAREMTLHAAELLASLEPDKQAEIVREILEGEDYWEIDPTDLKMLAKINGVMPAECLVRFDTHSESYCRNGQKESEANHVG